MTEKKIDLENKENQPTKQRRKKATIGAWWKSTTTVEPLPESPPEDPIKTPEKPAEAEVKKPRRSRRPSRSRKNPTQKTESKDGADSGAEDGSVVTEETSSQHAQTVVGSEQGTAGGASGGQRKRPSRRQGRGKSKEQQPREKETILAEKTGGGEDDLPETEAVESKETKSGGATGDQLRTEKTKAQTENSKERQHTRENRSPEKSQQAVKTVAKLLINAEEPEECRLALLENGQLESIHVATSTRVQTKNNIYKARIVAIEPNLQAAFVDYGEEKNGFLPFSEIHPEYYKQNVSEKAQRLIDQHQWKKLSITDVMERGREVLVQVVKEEVGKKGANMTTYLSLPGRCVVLMPGSDSKGISRKISGEESRTKLRDHMLALKIPEGIGWIVRTASNDITKTALGRDVSYLLRLWEEVKKKGQDLEGVGLIYQDHDHVLRFLREHFDPDLEEILVDSKDAFEQVKGFIEMLPAKQRKVKCKLHRGARPIFNQYSVEDQIESIYQPKVNLPSGGSIVIDPTEALVAIDVNSGSTSKGQNFEESIFQANMEAATELARQLRLRDLGGLIVVDFIDMRSQKHTREVERQVKNAMKRDKAKVDISRISKFGLMQISRQKLGAPIEAGNYRVCNHCKGRGIVRSVETLALYYLRRIHTGASRKMVRQIECRFPLDVAGYLLNKKRNEISELESRHNTEVIIKADPALFPADHEIIFHKAEKEDTEKKHA